MSFNVNFCKLSLYSPSLSKINSKHVSFTGRALLASLSENNLGLMASRYSIKFVKTRDTHSLYAVLALSLALNILDRNVMARSAILLLYTINIFTISSKSKVTESFFLLWFLFPLIICLKLPGKSSRQVSKVLSTILKGVILDEKN
jgi:hypothetical protein